MWLVEPGGLPQSVAQRSVTLYFSEAGTLGCIVVSCLRQMLALSIHRSSLVHGYICLSYSHLFDLQK